MSTFPSFRILVTMLFIQIMAHVYAQPLPESNSSFSPELNDPSKLPREEIYLHTDRNKYIAGENLWISIYNFNMLTGKLSEFSSIAYIEILNPWNVAVVQSRFFVFSGRGQGVILLPDSLSSGTYRIRAYTNWMKNFLPENCFMKNICVYNPFSKTGFKINPGSMDCLKISNNLSDVQNDEGDISVETDSAFNRRERVTIKLKPSGNSGTNVNTNFSISVVPAEAASLSEGLIDYMRTRTETTVDRPDLDPAKLKYGFESNGHHFKVKINYRDKNEIDSSDFVYLSVQGKVAEFNYAGREPDGTYTFILPIDTKLRNLILQPEHASNNMVLEVMPSFPDAIAPESLAGVAIPDSITEVFDKLSFNYQAGRIYEVRHKTEIQEIKTQKIKKRRFYGIPEMEIVLDDYIKLPSMQEVFYELLPGVNFVTKKSGYEILIINPLTGVFYNQAPLVMIDGVIINDLNVLADLDPEVVERIEVVKTPYLIGDLLLYGIVNVITRAGDFSDVTMPEYAIMLPYRVVERPAYFSSPAYPDENAKANRIPDLRNTLYWNPSVVTNTKGEAIIEFWTSDNPGIYSIDIEGITGDGRKVTLRKLFRVK